MNDRRSMVFSLALASASSLWSACARTLVPACAGLIASACADEEASPGGEEPDEGDASAESDAQTGSSPDASTSFDARVADANTADVAAPSPNDAARDAQSSSDAAGARDASAPRDAQVGMQLTGPSAGCGKPTSDAAGKFTTKTLRVGDRDRTYHVYIPEGYQPTRQYPVIFRFHGSTGNGLSGGLDVQNVAAKEVIIVAPDGTGSSPSTLSWSPNAAELALFDALVSTAGENYCVDRGRMFAFGFSAGAGLSEMLACVRGNALRGVGAIAGYDWGRGRTCEGQVAAWLVHDANDQPAPIAGGRAARDRLLQQNGCSMETEPAGSTCVRYRGCADGHPVVWCETQGMGHNIRGDYGPGEVWKFFSGLP